MITDQILLSPISINVQFLTSFTFTDREEYHPAFPDPLFRAWGTPGFQGLPTCDYSAPVGNVGGYDDRQMQ